jgi:hypothetical protein
MNYASFRNRSNKRRRLRLDKTLHFRKGQFEDLRHPRAAESTGRKSKHSYSMLQDCVLLKSSATHIVVASQESPTLLAYFWKKYRIPCSGGKMIEMFLVANPRFFQDLM